MINNFLIWSFIFQNINFSLFPPPTPSFGLGLLLVVVATLARLTLVGICLLVWLRFRYFCFHLRCTYSLGSHVDISLKCLWLLTEKVSILFFILNEAVDSEFRAFSLLLLALLLILLLGLTPVAFLLLLFLVGDNVSLGLLIYCSLGIWLRLLLNGYLFFLNRSHRLELLVDTEVLPVHLTCGLLVKVPSGHGLLNPFRVVGVAVHVAPVLNVPNLLARE